MNQSLSVTKACRVNAPIAALRNASRQILALQLCDDLA